MQRIAGATWHFSLAWHSVRFIVGGRSELFRVTRSLGSFGNGWHRVGLIVNVRAVMFVAA